MIERDNSNDPEMAEAVAEAEEIWGFRTAFSENDKKAAVLEAERIFQENRQVQKIQQIGSFLDAWQRKIIYASGIAGASFGYSFFNSPQLYGYGDFRDIFLIGAGTLLFSLGGMSLTGETFKCLKLEKKIKYFKRIF
jgi:hypothetical protein